MRHEFFGGDIEELPDRVTPTLATPLMGVPREAATFLDLRCFKRTIIIVVLGNKKLG